MFALEVAEELGVHIKESSSLPVPLYFRCHYNLAGAFFFFLIISNYEVVAMLNTQCNFLTLPIV